MAALEAKSGCVCHYPICIPARSALRMCEMVRHIGQLRTATQLGQLTQWRLAKHKKNTQKTERDELLLLQRDFTII